MTRTTPSRWMSLHLSQIFFTDARTFILNLPYYPSPRQVVFTELDFHTVARQKPDPIPHRLSGPVSQHMRLVSQFQPVYQAGQLFQNHCLDRHGRYYGLVKTHGPLAVTATQCSK